MNKSSTFELLQQAPSFFASSRGPDHVFELANEAYVRVIGRRDILGSPVRIALPELVGAHATKPIEPREILASAAAFARRKRSGPTSSPPDSAGPS